MARMRQRLAPGLLALALVLSLVAVAHQATRRAPDFATRYSAGQAVARHLDPYDASAVDPIENGHLGAEYDYPFHDPPPVAWAFRAVAAVPYHLATRLWLLLLLASAWGCAVLALRAAGLGSGGLEGAGIVAVVGLNFAPLRNAIGELQLDPVIGVLALSAYALARRPGAGLLQALATLKPQAGLLASAGGLARGRLRFALGLLLGWAALLASTAFVSGPGWRAWIRAAHHASRAHGTSRVALGVALAVAAFLLAALVLRRSAEPVVVLAAAAAANGAIAPLIFLNPQSDVLVLVPLLLLVGGPANEWLLGAALGVFSVSGLFAVTYHAGLPHAGYPVLEAVVLAAWAWLRFPAARRLVAVALPVNVAVTVAPLPPGAYAGLAEAACLALLGLLARSPAPRPVARRA